MQLVAWVGLGIGVIGIMAFMAAIVLAAYHLRWR